jgi:4-azaleucine resistance transporter AzlC
VNTDLQARRRVARDAVAIGLATGAYGLSYGAIAVASGLTVGQASFLSLFAFTGASQFALVGVVGAGGSAVAAVAAALLLGARNTLYAVRLAELIGAHGIRRPLAAQLVIDETTAMAVAQTEPALARRAFWYTGAAVFVCWNLATVIGAVAGDLIADPTALGLDAAFPAAFLALLAPRLRERPALLAAIAGAAVALLATPFLPAGLPVLVAVVPALAIAVWRRTTARQPAETCSR